MATADSFRYFRFGELTSYYLGVQADQWPRPGHAWLLGCECGEAGCRPFTARIIAAADTVTWTDFGQDNHPAWDYSGFGPFVFLRASYDEAVREAARAAHSEWT